MKLGLHKNYKQYHTANTESVNERNTTKHFWKIWKSTRSKHFFQSWKSENYDLTENTRIILIEDRLRKSHIKAKCIIFLCFDRCIMILPRHLHSIYKICTLWRWYFPSYLKFACRKPGSNNWRKKVQSLIRPSRREASTWSLAKKNL